jgi:hypothetical protein
MNPRQQMTAAADDPEFISKNNRTSSQLSGYNARGSGDSEQDPNRD